MNLIGCGKANVIKINKDEIPCTSLGKGEGTVLFWFFSLHLVEKTIMFLASIPEYRNQEEEWGRTLPGKVH